MKTRSNYVIFLFYILFGGVQETSCQGFCGKYTCERNKDFSSTLILKCLSDSPETTNGHVSNNRNYDCTTDLHFLDLVLGVTICSNNPLSYSMNVLPETATSRELQRLYRYLQLALGRTTDSRAYCYHQKLTSTVTPTPAPGGVTRSSTMRNHVARSVLIGAIIGAFFGGALVAAIVLVSIYFCCKCRKKDKNSRFVTPRINEAYRLDPNDNLDTSPTDLTQKDWNREHRGRIDRLNGMINAFTLENVVDPYASIDGSRPERTVDRENDPPVPPRNLQEEISAMYSQVDRTKKRRAPNANNLQGVGRANASDLTDSSENAVNDQKTNNLNKDTSESVASSSEIVQPQNSFHLYHILEKPEL